MNWLKENSWVKQNRRLAASLAIGLLATVVYLNILPNPFIWSEEEVIVDSTVHRDLGNIPRFFTTEYWLKEDPFAAINIFRPIRAVTFTIEYALWGLNPVPYHVFNIVIHAITSLVVFLLAKKISKNFLVGLFAGLLFAVHPIHTETVTWTMSRDDILTTLFSLSAWWFFIKRLENSRRKWVYLLLEVGFFSLALLTREIAMVLPFLLGLYVMCVYEKKEWRRTLMASWPYWVLSGGYLFYHFYFWWESLKTTRLEQSLNLPLINHGFLIIKTVGDYVWLLVWPVRLAADWYFPLYVSMGEIGVVMSVVLMAVLAFLIFWLIKRKQKLLVFALGFTLLSFLPVANIIIVMGRPFGEQREYMPSIGFCLFLAIVLVKIYAKNKKVALVILGLLIGFYSLRTVARNYDWRSPVVLWETNLNVSPYTERARNNLIVAYSRTGQTNKMVLQLEAMSELKKALRKNNVKELEVLVDLKGKPIAALELPGEGKEGAALVLSGESKLHYELGRIYLLDAKEMKRAAYEFDLAIKYDPRNFYAYEGLGVIDDELGNSESAIQAFQKGIAINSDYFSLHENLADILEREGRYEEAVVESKKAVELQPSYAEAYLRLVRIYAQKLNDKETARNYWKMLESLGTINPTLKAEMETVLKE